jgi:bifunctional ADP-heptose synthase (sugar kinase/adenylyltransferase)
VKVVSKVGAGDSFVGAFTLALSRGDAAADCLRFGVAAASSAVTTEATRLCDRKMTEALMAGKPRAGRLTRTRSVAYAATAPGDATFVISTRRFGPDGRRRPSRHRRSSPAFIEKP